MAYEKTHLSDEEILLFADAELSPERTAEAVAHLIECQTCSARMKVMQSAAESLVRAYRADLDHQLPPGAASRAVLQARMAALSNGAEKESWWDRAADLFAGPRLAYAAGIIVVMALGVRALTHEVSARNSRTLVAESDAGPMLPEADLTPGATRPIDAREVCRPGPADQMATIPMPVRQAVFHEYGMDHAQARNYEVDHLITPELGGTDDIRNLWPEPHASTTWNSYVKDELEDRLRQLVCEGKVDLPTAQRDIATDWIAAYQKYFHTDKPLSSVSSLIREKRVDAD